MSKYPYKSSFGELVRDHQIDRVFDIDLDAYYDVIPMWNVIKVSDKSYFGLEFSTSDEVMVEEYYDGTIIVINRANARTLRLIPSKTVTIKL